MYGLIIKKKWLNKILSGKKTLEIRGNNTSHIGEVIALIESGTSTIRGFCKIQETIPLDEKRWAEERANHCVDLSFSEIKERYRTPYGWHLCGVIPCSEPIKYQHPKGAVIWVNLDKVLISVGLNDYINPNTMDYIYQFQREIRKRQEDSGKTTLMKTFVNQIDIPKLQVAETEFVLENCTKFYS